METQQKVKSRPVRVSRRGVSIILVGVVLVGLIAFVSLAVDIGRVRLANAELQTAADAAARAGAYSLWGNNQGNPNVSQDVINEAVAAALQNPAIDTVASGANKGMRTNPGVVIDPDRDVQFGLWVKDANGVYDFTKIVDAPGGADARRGANAVLVTAKRLQSRGNPVKLIFAPVLGVFSSDVKQQSIAYITAGPDRFAFIGIDFIKSNGNKAKIVGGGVASDGDLNLGNGDVVGDARPGIGHTYNPGPNSVVTGWTAPLDYKLATDDRWKPIANHPAGASSLPTTGKITLNGSSDPDHPTMYFGTAVPSTFTISGLYVRLYINGSALNMAPNITYTNPANPSNNPIPPSLAAAARFQLYGYGNAAQTLSPGNGNVQIFAHVFAPTADFAIGGGVDFHGVVVAKSISYKGNSTLTYDGSKDTASDHWFVVRTVNNTNRWWPDE